MTAVSSVITSRMQQYNNFVEERLKKRTKSSKKPLQKKKLHVFVQQQDAKKNLPWQSAAMTAHCFCIFTLHARQGKGTCQNFSGTKTNEHHHHWANWVICGQVKKADLLKCLEHSLLGSGNSDEEEVLVDETNNTDYEEMVDPVSMISPLKSSSVELSLNLVCRKRNNWSAKTLLHTLLQTTHLKQMWRSLTVHLLFKCSPTGHQTLSRTTATASFCLTFLDNFRVFNGYYLGCLSHRQLEGQDKKQTGGQGQHICCWRNKGGRAVGCIWDWKTFQIYCNPGKYWCRQIKSFACLSHCNWLWHSLSLWLERKTEAWNTWTAFPTMASAFLET